MAMCELLPEIRLRELDSRSTKRTEGCGVRAGLRMHRMAGSSPVDGGARLKSHTILVGPPPPTLRCSSSTMLCIASSSRLDWTTDCSPIMGAPFAPSTTREAGSPKSFALHTSMRVRIPSSLIVTNVNTTSPMKCELRNDLRRVGELSRGDIAQRSRLARFGLTSPFKVGFMGGARPTHAIGHREPRNRRQNLGSRAKR